ncbi:ArsR family transcriptional regulator [Natrarchaeobius chitinivorans]|uniref:ArsR family transcriptional regulator n=1 Tax=Natrarchaeobius chitinivorans TaxID=1679083 RepID=A0A3N6P3I7_NATCH|nr:ArsR family transcriptional regulator [Natrarchaeobius chitinivorans]
MCVYNDDVCMCANQDELYDAISNETRRNLLFSLLNEAPQTDLPNNLDTPPGNLDRIEYRHKHLPKLDDYGFINWNRELDRVERGPRFGDVRPVLEALYKHHAEFKCSPSPQ